VTHSLLLFFDEYRCCGNTQETCVDHPQCAALGLEGACCPTVDNVYLDCCEKEWCLAKYHQECVSQGLDGPTCPDDQGNFADCCMPDLVARSFAYVTTDSPPNSSAMSSFTVELFKVLGLIYGGTLLLRWW
jgi:hypothetical protein